MTTAEISSSVGGAAANALRTPKKTIERPSFLELYGNSLFQNGAAICALSQSIFDAKEQPDPAPLIAERVSRLLEDPNDPARNRANLVQDAFCLAGFSEVLSDLEHYEQAVRVAQESVRIQIQANLLVFAAYTVSPAFAKLGLARVLPIANAIPDSTMRNRVRGGLATSFFYEGNLSAALECIGTIDPEALDAVILSDASLEVNQRVLFPGRPEVHSAPRTAPPQEPQTSSDQGGAAAAAAREPTPPPEGKESK